MHFYAEKAFLFVSSCHNAFMQNKKTKADPFYERLAQARHSFYKRNQKRLEEMEKNPIDWNATIKSGKTVYQKNKK